MWHFIIGIFTRRTKVVSKKKSMVDLTLRLWHHVVEGSLFGKFQAKAMSIFKWTLLFSHFSLQIGHAFGKPSLFPLNPLQSKTNAIPQKSSLVRKTEKALTAFTVRAWSFLVAGAGFEPTTFGLWALFYRIWKSLTQIDILWFIFYFQ